MTDLITRLSKLDAPDREVDAELEAVSLGGRVYLNDPESKEVIIERPIDGFWIRGIYPYRKIARYTASVDAAIALAERVLPGFNADLDIGTALNADAKFGCRLWRDYSEAQNYEGEAFNSATALLIAILRAKEASK
nr:hypothetical protein [Brucella intermedia]